MEAKDKIVKKETNKMSLAQIKEQMIARKGSIFGTVQKDRINHFTPPLNIRNNCSAGEFRIGQNDTVGKSLKVGIIKILPFYGKLGKTLGQWLQVWFVGAPSETKIPRNVVCVTYVKTQSATELSDTLIKIMDTQDPGMVLFDIGFEKQANEHGTYYSLTYDWSERSTDEEIEQLGQIFEFLDTNPSLVDTNLPATMESLANKSDDQIAEAKKSVVALLEASATEKATN